jgi:hypothetical protein
MKSQLCLIIVPVTHQIHRLSIHSSLQRVIWLSLLHWQQQPQASHFELWIVAWTDELVESILEVFRHFAERGIEWDSFTLNTSGLTLQLSSPVLRTANELCLFRKIKIDTLETIPGDPEGQFLFPGVSLNRRLDDIDVNGPGSEISNGDFRALSQCMETTTNLKSLSFYGSHNLDVNLFCQGINMNKTLTELHLELNDCDITDESLARVIMSLTSHPTIGSFEICGCQRFGNWSLKAIQELLISSSSLRSLSLQDCDCEEGWSRLSMPFSELLSAVHHCTLLESLTFTAGISNTSTTWSSHWGIRSARCLITKGSHSRRPISGSGSGSGFDSATHFAFASGCLKSTFHIITRSRSRIIGSSFKKNFQRLNGRIK